MSTTIESKYRQLKVPELKDLLVKKGLPVSGKKEELVARLLAAEDKKIVEPISQTPKSNSMATSTNTISTRKSSIDNIINKVSMETTTLHTEGKNDDTDLFDKDLNLISADITSGIDNDFWDNITTDITIPKDGEFDSLISPFSPSLSVTSIKDLSPEKAKSEIPETTKGSNNVTNVEAKNSVETTNDDAKTSKAEPSSPNSDNIVKPSGFTCKKIVFDNAPKIKSPQLPSKEADLATELERRKKRAERFGVGLSDSDKKLQRAARFGTTVSNPLDSPLTAPRLPNRKPSIVENEEKLKKRAERFGLDISESSTNTTNTLSEEEKKRKRAERFGLNASPNSVSNSINEEDKKKRRAERLSINTSGEPTNKKVKT
ncbi:9694_t:CDS:2 [Funneliformis mosseae]|uniref:9694_t:CDS:1 n=1 Tax=Funneliformis mosseae TaxID=27381 RepID=A0A9N9DS50_FUNMO|nr:9694_t:CDS:2 [Funneliformis mosseae]